MKRLPLFIQKFFKVGYYNEADRVKRCLRAILKDKVRDIDCLRICKVNYRFGTLHIYTERPGLVIGRKGELYYTIEECVSKLLGKKVKVKLHEIKVW